MDDRIDQHSRQDLTLATAAGPAPAADRWGQMSRLAERLLAGAPRAANSLSWSALESAPAWLGWRQTELLTLQRRVGAVFCAPALRLWIDRSRVLALRAALGTGFVQALLRGSDRVHAAVLPLQLPDWPLGEETQTPESVAELLRSCGAAVLVCTLPHGPLRHAASQALAPLAELMMPAAHAQTLVAHALALGRATALPVTVGTASALTPAASA